MKYNEYQGKTNPYSLNFTQALQRIRNYTARQDKAIGYYLPEFINTPLPHSDPGQDNFYQRLNGSWKLKIRPARDFGYPYGSTARLFLCWLTSEVWKNHNKAKANGKEIVEVNWYSKRLYHGSFYEFADTLGYEGIGGGKRGIATYLDRQIKAFLHCTYDFWNMSKEHAGKGFRGTEKWDITFNREDIEEDPERSYFEISQSLYENIIDSCIPIDLRAFNALRGSPLAMDLYCWITRKVYDISAGANPKPQAISWRALKPQFGENYKRTKDFAYKAKKALEKIQALYISLEIEYPRGRVVIHPGPPHVPI